MLKGIKESLLTSPSLSSVSMASPLVSSDLTPLVSSDLTPLVSDLTPLVSGLTPLVSGLTPLVSDLTPLVSDLTPLVSSDLAPFSLALRSLDFSHCSKFSSRALSTSTPISSCSFSVGFGPSTNDDSSSSSVSGTILKVRKRV